MFERFVEDIAFEPMSGCWLWIGQRLSDRHGGPSYGRIAQDSKRVPAHRLFYITERGPIPEGMVLDHLCLMPCCVNPFHLEIVTDAENKRREIMRRKREQTHCKRGHEFTPENTRVFGNNQRECRQCARDRASAFHAARRAEHPPHSDACNCAKCNPHETEDPSNEA